MHARYISLLLVSAMVVMLIIMAVNITNTRFISSFLLLFFPCTQYIHEWFHINVYDRQRGCNAVEFNSIQICETVDFLCS